MYSTGNTGCFEEHLKILSLAVVDELGPILYFSPCATKMTINLSC